MMVDALDCSAVQGPIDGAQLKAAGYGLVYLRCGVGNDAPDTCFDRNRASLEAAGVPCGPYNFVYPLPDAPGHPGRDPVSQARAHFAAAKGLGTKAGEAPPATDCEWPPPQDWAKWGCSADQIKAWVLAYQAEVERLWGRVPLLYGYPDFFAHLRPGPEFARYPLWLASYQAQPAKVAPWDAPLLWQRNGGGGKLANGRPVDIDGIDDFALQQLLAGPA